MALTERQKEKILSSLRTKAKAHCPMCGGTNWELWEEMVGAMAASPQGGIGIGGPYIPMVQIVCTNCGFVSHHAVGVLGIDLKE
jgi:hypothetical protein